MKVSKKSQLVTLRLTKGNFKKEQKISLTEWNVGTIKFLKNWSFNNFVDETLPCLIVGQDNQFTTVP